MAAGKVSSLSRKSIDCVGVRVTSRKGFEHEVSERNGVFESFDVDDGVVVSPPEKRRKLCTLIPDGYVSGDDDREPGQIVEEDSCSAPSISMSRWACDDEEDIVDGGVKGGGKFGGEEKKGRSSSSPESGVTQKEGSDGYVGRVLGFYSDDERDFGNEDRMEVDVWGGEDSESDSDAGSQDEVPGQGKRSMLQSCRSVFEYEKLGKINEGSYGIVYKARDKSTGELVALKKLKMGNDREGFPVHYLREINTLLAFDHPSVIKVREVVVDDSYDAFDNIYMVMDYVEHDVKALMQARKQPFSQSEVKCLMHQLLEGVKYCHDNWVLHRDLKTSNLLINNKGELKICDFGMARQYGSPLKPYTALVVTLWYRAPELLLGAKEYSTAVDMWSVGCIMAELLTNKPLFDGKTELEQLNKIFKTLGTPNDTIWPGYSQLPVAKANFVHQPYNQLHKKFPRTSFTGSPALSMLGLDLLSKLLTYDPEKRMTVDEALNHRWFQEVPLPMDKDFMPTLPPKKASLPR